MGETAQAATINFLFHPMLVHFPIAFYFLELLLLILWVLKRDEAYRRFAYFSFKLGYIFMMMAMIAGLIDVGGFSNIRGLVQRHVIGAVAIFILYTIRGIFYLKTKDKSSPFATLKIAGAILGNLLMFYTGFLGGVLVFG